jgi:hypothetical protein
MQQNLKEWNAVPLAKRTTPSVVGEAAVDFFSRNAPRTERLSLPECWHPAELIQMLTSLARPTVPSWHSALNAQTSPANSGAEAPKLLGPGSFLWLQKPPKPRHRRVTACPLFIVDRAGTNVVLRLVEIPHYRPIGRPLRGREC